ncbi:MAG TPA: NAD-dependent epimerase/dehydratase family protein [Steroidobacteraceae bacterium]|nr:NAD-dependent epimerase/dehydratase family protein [Steroidobacteraceae bacterium]
MTDQLNEPAVQRALVLGANGGIGNETMHALLRHGWRVRAMARTISRSALSHPHLEWRAGDVMNRGDVMDAARDVQVIVHAVNPAKYHNWRGLALPMLDNTIAAATSSRARIVLTGTLYNYGPDAFPIVDEEAPQNPHTRKGAIRVEMEERLRDASWEGRVRALIVRAGDFFGARARSNWFSQGMVMPGRPVQVVFNPGKPDLEHSWAYLPDVAETIVRLLDQESSLAKFDTYHFKGYYLRNAEMARVICNAAGISDKRVLPFPWWAIRASAHFVERSNEMLEMRYLWNEAIELDNRKLRARIGTEPHTPIEEAIRSTLIGIRCISNASISAARAGSF